jgi:hypothetical protein
VIKLVKLETGEERTINRKLRKLGYNVTDNTRTPCGYMIEKKKLYKLNCWNPVV